jgi:hypothetical protein
VADNIGISDDFDISSRIAQMYSGVVQKDESIDYNGSGFNQ